MADDFKGLIVSITIIGILILGITSFIIGFPADEGMTIQAGQDQSAYVQTSQVSSSMQNNLTSNLGSTGSSTQTGFDQWDIGVGFMGSNTIKQASRGGVWSMITSTGSNVKTMATLLFSANSPIVWVIVTILSLAGLYLTILVIQFIRTGR